jgi:23S rRNA (uracil1939-C5)-methyltransferase
LLGTPMREQLERKRAVVERALREHSSLAGLGIAPCLPSPRASGYRNRAKMALAWGEVGRLGLGYFRPRSREVVDAPDCRVLEPAILETTRQLRKLFDGMRRPPRVVRFVDVRCGSEPTRQHLTLVVDDVEIPDLPLRDIEAACPHVKGMSVNLNPGTGAQVIKGPVKHLWGERGVVFELPSATLLVSPGSFFQVNAYLLPAIHARMRGHFEGCRVLADLYAGVGTHGLALASAFERVACIEGVTAAVRDAKTSVETSKATNVTIVGSPVEKALSTLHSIRPDAVALNPSREGARPEVLKALASGSVRRIAYLSCDPRTLARDLDLLVSGGLDVHSVEPIDMMPQTLHVEALALLVRASRSPRARPRARRSR